MPIFSPIDWLRKQGQKVAAKRSDREAKEGVVIAQTTTDNKTGFVVCISCETDFVSKNAEFVAFAQSIADAAISNNVKSADELNAATFCPCLRSQSIAASKSPFASVNALRQSIIPAPVAWRSLFMSAAVIVTLIFIAP